MSAGMPELGSKISLISKADIRYEGRLYTVDPQECTIALSNVRSFGTEDRETQFQIAPQSQIYDYILFRGSDIKDIRVVNNSLPHPNDPAIMQVQLQNGQHMMPHFPMPNMNPPHAPPMNAVGGYGNPFGMGGLGIGGAGGAAPSLAPGSGAPGPYILGGGNQPQSTQPPQPQQQQQSKSQQQQKQPNILAGASRSTTPMSHVSLKSGSPDLAAQQQHQNQHPNQNTGHGGNSRDAGHKRQNHQQRGGNNNQRNNDFYQQSRDRRDSGRHTDGNYNNQRNNHQRGGGGGGGGQNHAWTMHRGGPNNANNMMVRNRGGGRGRMQNQGFRPMGGPGGNQNKPRNPKNAIKFLQDFDFEQANVKFEELRSQLSKLKVGEEPKTEQINGETDKKEDSGNETGAGEHEPEEEEITVGYDKTKSFFDNISCEAAQDRSKNKKNDWRQERKLNSETFGFSSTRRGGYRGRGNYYNRNMGSYGGGYNRNYRGGSNYRNRSRNPNAAANNANGGASNTNTGNSGTSNNNNSANTAVALKSQVQTPQTSVSASGSTPNATKLATVENSNTPQPIAAGGVGQ
ncbi:protein LSM14 homolog B isoform X3 [Bactrocera neohumeralis]|uniref:protein LSM14 homolog B isoform X2 n=1 Tax=Bactrocera tryoni TaxID=59916 RepID=UPI001A984148|nr:protein LSM14 homolog B isoform X2 [Bactrocera tryoni]XP_050337340.1 protein LSM14 homolog B isoform X3 [Bactrocera neohumeralis]